MGRYPEGEERFRGSDVDMESSANPRKINYGF